MTGRGFALGVWNRKRSLSSEQGRRYNTAMLLAIDVGNTNIVVGIFDGERLVGHWRAATDAQRMSDEYAVLIGGFLNQAGFAFADVDAVSLASVVPALTSAFE